MKSKGQIWIETVIYTVIGLSLIALVLAFVTPKILQARDKAIVEQAIQSMQNMDEKINVVASKGAGNVRNIEFTIKKGSLLINPGSDSVVFTLDRLQTPYSEINTSIPIGSVKVMSSRVQGAYSVSLILNYTLNITYSGSDISAPKTFTRSSIPYRFSITNKDNSFIDISETSGN